MVLKLECFFLVFIIARFSLCVNVKSVLSQDSEDICQLPMAAGNCYGSVVSWFYDARSGVCRLFTFRGCGGNENRFSSRVDCEDRCKLVVAKYGSSKTTTEQIEEDLSSDCIISRDFEECTPEVASVVWYYDRPSRDCEIFVNRETGTECRTTGVFSSEEACQRVCGNYKYLDACQARLDPGPCQASYPKYFYNESSRRCEEFVYGGCAGGANRFSSGRECEQVCLGAGEPYLSANGKNFYPSREEQILKFYNGQSFSFNCYKTPRSSQYVKLVYITEDGNSIDTNFKDNDSVSMYIKVMTAQNDTVLTCVIYEYVTDSRTHIKLRLIVHTNRRDISSLEVNGYTYIVKMGDNEDVPYHYYEGETITVGSAKDEETNAHAECRASGPHVPQTLQHYVKNTLTLANFTRFSFILHAIDANTSLTCAVSRFTMGYVLYYSSIRVTFVLNTPYYSPFIFGLPTSYIWLQYNKSSKDDNIIEYIIGNETLHLHCSSDHNNLSTTWHFNNSEIITPKKAITSFRPFQLRPNQSSASIECRTNSSTPDRITYLKLIRNNATNAGIKTTTIQPDSNSSSWVMVACILLLACIVTITMFIVRRCYRRSEDANPGRSEPRDDAGRFGPRDDAVRVGAGNDAGGVGAGNAVGQVGIGDDAGRFRPRDDAGRVGAGNDAGWVGPRDDASSTEMYHIYETIDDPVYDETYVVSKTVTPPVEPPGDIARRAPYPLPAEASEVGNGSRYVHYDTPYEFRIFRLGVPPAADLFQTKRGGRSNCHSPRGARR